MIKNKRFKLDFDENVFIDEYEKGELKRSYTVINGKMKEYQLQEIVDLLNKLSKENEELKRKHCNELMEEGVKIERLREENKELKQENKILEKNYNTLIDDIEEYY